MSRICVVGAGPKAAALVARAAVLRQNGVKVPDIVIIEKIGIGAAWSGAGGFSNGILTLCSPAEKDVGFPYVDTIRRHGFAVSHEVFKRFAWSSYLVAVGAFAEWVDRGRNHPSHLGWSEYLSWVFEEAEQPVEKGVVTSVTRIKSGWKVNYETDDGSEVLMADGVVFTGVGDPRRVREVGDIPPDRIYDPKTFWANTSFFKALPDETRIVVVGDGGAAGAIVAWLSSALADTNVVISSVSPLGTLLPRGDGYAERRWFSDPADWKDLSIEHRLALLKRTEAGVISLRNKSIIDASYRVEYVVGKATEVTWEADAFGQELTVYVDYLDDRTPLKADYLINGMGFDPWSQLEMVSHPLATLFNNGKLRSEAEAGMRDDLTFPVLTSPSGKKLEMSRLHIPAMASLAQGPGMGTLGCLGLVAAAILDPYTK